MDEDTITLGDELARLNDQRDQLASEIAQIPEDDCTAENPEYARRREAATRIESQRGGVQWAINEWDPDATITIRGLSASEHARVYDRAANTTTGAVVGGGENQSAENAKQNLLAAMGVRDAPFLDGDVDFDGCVQAVGDLPPQLRSWLAARTNDLTAVGGTEEGNESSESFADLVAAKRQSQTET